MIDLHIHTTFSDGEMLPEKIVDMAKQNNVTCLSIADHDSISAYSDSFFEYAKKNNIDIIPAVEMSTRFYGRGIHVLGYNFNLQDKELLKCLSQLQNARLDYLLKVSEKLNLLGYQVNVEKLKQLPSITKNHISFDVVSNVQNEKLLVKQFGYVPERGEFIETIMNEGCPAFIEKFSITPIQASKIIKNAGGKVILAHPVVCIHEDNLSFEQIDSLIKEMNADGIEGNYLFVDSNNNVIDDSELWNNYAIKNNLISTIGSDYHKTDNIRPEVGFVNTNFKLNSEQIDVILNRLKSKNK